MGAAPEDIERIIEAMRIAKKVMESGPLGRELKEFSLIKSWDDKTLTEFIKETMFLPWYELQSLCTHWKAPSWKLQDGNWRRCSGRSLFESEGRRISDFVTECRELIDFELQMLLLCLLWLAETRIGQVSD